MTKAQLLKKCPWLNPNGWYAGECVRRFNADNKTSSDQIETQIQLYAGWWESKHPGEVWKAQKLTDRVVIETTKADFVFRDVRAKYWAKLLKKLNKAKMLWIVQSTHFINGEECYSGYANHPENAAAKNF